MKNSPYNISCDWLYGSKKTGFVTTGILWRRTGSGHIGQGWDVHGTYLPRDTLTKGCIVQGTRWPRDASFKRCDVQGMHCRGRYFFFEDTLFGDTLSWLRWAQAMPPFPPHPSMSIPSLLLAFPFPASFFQFHAAVFFFTYVPLCETSWLQVCNVPPSPEWQPTSIHSLHRTGF